MKKKLLILILVVSMTSAYVSIVKGAQDLIEVPLFEKEMSVMAVDENKPIICQEAVLELAAGHVAVDENEFVCQDVELEPAEAVKEPTAEEKAAEERAAEERAAEERAAEERAAEERAVEERAAEERAAEERAAEERAAEERAAEKAAKERAARYASVIKDGRENIVVLPFDNLSKGVNAIEIIMPEVKRLLNDRGLYVIDDDILSDFLCDKRVRSAGYVSKEITREMGEKLGAKTVLAGAVVSFSSKGTPNIGVLARLIDSSTGVILWAEYAAVSGDDYSNVFGVGTIKKIKDLVPKALDKLFASFSMDISNKNTESVYRIAVMPFKNKTDNLNSGMITTYMFLVELLKDPAFEPVEYGEIKKVYVDLRIRNKSELEFKNIKALSESLGISGILLGSVDNYSAKTNASSVPKVGITARLLDARENRILWYNNFQLSGEEDTIAFDWGSVRQVDKLAYKAVSELVKKMKKNKWY